MAVQVATNCALFVNGTDLSSFASEASLTYSADILDRTTFGQTGNPTHLKVGGLKMWELSATFLWQSTGTNPEATLFNLVGTTSCVEFRPFNTCSSANNPIYSGIAVLNSFPVTGQIGKLIEAKVKFEPASALNRASSS